MSTSVSTTTFTSKSFSMMSDNPDLASFIKAGKNCHCCMSTAAERKSSRVWISNLDWWAYDIWKGRQTSVFNSTSSCTWRRPSTAQRWPPPPPSRRPPPGHKEFQSPFHNCDIRWLHHHRGQIPTLVLVRMFGVLCCYCLVWWCQDIWWEVQSAWEDRQVWKSLLVIWYRSAILCFG